MWGENRLKGVKTGRVTTCYYFCFSLDVNWCRVENVLMGFSTDTFSEINKAVGDTGTYGR